MAILVYSIKHKRTAEKLIRNYLEFIKTFLTPPHKLLQCMPTVERTKISKNVSFVAEIKITIKFLKYINFFLGKVCDKYFQKVRSVFSKGHIYEQRNMDASRKTVP
jgi:carbon monoxide dehydrogenase subunit G